jgi:CelD/BcsL family acetyltransferase involved in cellulose biosynthesis
MHVLMLSLEKKQRSKGRKKERKTEEMGQRERLRGLE